MTTDDVHQAGSPNGAAVLSNLMRPVEGRRGLAAEIARRVSAEIESGALVSGARLPTEQEMIAATGVSRTVVREAVAALRAEGLVVTRQGVGAFVSADIGRLPFRVEADSLGSLNAVLDVMELRAAVEARAASLAAERATSTQRRAIASALRALERAIGRGEAAISEDFAFHAAVATGTRNPQFARFLEYLGRFIIPRQSVRLSAADLGTYLRTLQTEHRAIAEAIEASDPGAAETAMRSHLDRSRERYLGMLPERGRLKAMGTSGERGRPGRG